MNRSENAAAAEGGMPETDDTPALTHPEPVTEILHGVSVTAVSLARRPGFAAQASLDQRANALRSRGIWTASRARTHRERIREFLVAKPLTP